MGLTKAAMRKRMKESRNKIMLCYVDGSQHLSPSCKTTLIKMSNDLDRLMSKLK